MGSRLYRKLMASLFVCAIGVLTSGDVKAKSTYVIGDDEHPWAESGTFEQMDTTDPDWIQIVHVDPNENLIPGLWDRGGEIDAPRYSAAIQYSDEDKHRMSDGDWSTAFVHRPEWYIGYWGHDWITFNLGAPFPLNRLRFRSREAFRGRMMQTYIVQVWDGRTATYNASQKRWYLTYQLIREETNNLSPVVELEFPTQVVQAVRIRPGPPDRTWELAEMEAYGEGYVPLPATYTSNVIDIKEVVGPDTIATWGKIRWKGWRDEGAEVEIQTRSGDDPTPEVYWRKTGVGEEQVSWSESGEPLTKKQYKNLLSEMRGWITPDREHWSFWSAPYDFDEGLEEEGVPIASPSPCRYFQIRVKITPTSTDAAGLDQIGFTFSHKIPAYEILAEISPVEVSSRKPTRFTYALRPRIRGEDTGFDGLEIMTPTRADTVISVRIDRVDVEDFTTEYKEDRFIVHFPKVVRDQTLVEVDFDCLVLAYTRFEGRVFDSTLDELPQLVSPGDVTDRLLSNSLSVRTFLEEPMILTLDASPNPFTPNGDGIHDVLNISYNLLRLTGSAPVLLGIYDPSGKLVKEVYRGKDENDRYVQTWDGRDQGGEVVSPGMYIVRLSVEADQGEENKARTVVVVY